MGLTVIYIPIEGANLSADEASSDKELIKRLEGEKETASYSMFYITKWSVVQNLIFGVIQ